MHWRECAKIFLEVTGLDVMVPLSPVLNGDTTIFPFMMVELIVKVTGCDA
jgi:hypothetical protein